MVRAWAVSPLGGPTSLPTIDGAWAGGHEWSSGPRGPHESFTLLCSLVLCCRRHSPPFSGSM